MLDSYYKKTEAIVQQAQINYLVHPSTHILVRLTHGDLSAERANCKFHTNFFCLFNVNTHISFRSKRFFQILRK